MKNLRTDWQIRWLALDVTHPKLQRLGDVAEKFCRNWIQQTPTPGLLFLCGPTGTGKTHAARRIYRFCRSSVSIAHANIPAGRIQTVNLGFWHWPALADEFNSKNFSALDDIFATDFVVLDDVGAENDPFKIAADKLCQVLSRREKKFTIITSNKSPGAFADTDPRITDRLMRNSKTVELSGVISYSELSALNGNAI